MAHPVRLPCPPFFSLHSLTCLRIQHGGMLPPAEAAIDLLAPAPRPSPFGPYDWGDLDRGRPALLISGGAFARLRG